MSTAKKFTLAGIIAALILTLLLNTCSQPTAPVSTPTPVVPPQTENPETLAEFWLGQAADTPEDPETLYQLALAQTITDPEAAGETLNQLEALTRDYTQQISRLRAALRRGLAVGDRAYQLTQAGQALASLSEWKLAEMALQAAVTEDPEYAEAWAYLGEVQSQNGKDGYPALETAITLNRDSYAANTLMGLHWRRAGLPDNAIPYLEKALQIAPGNLALMEDLANTMIQAGEVEAAFELLNQAVEDASESSESWAVLARVSIENDLQVENVGIPAARNVVVAQPDQAEPMILLGRGYLLTGNTQLAERFFSQASQTDPGLAEPHYYLGLLYYNLSDYAAAETHLQTAIDLAQAAGQTNIQQQAEQLLSKMFQ